ncbi:MAG TPA: carboxypeptidase-like regulatory domain-containing protein [Bryobacteraceae bacterium]|nr:carboxypeptidase-like regulatory domain-containing protein [Bryobacteraceae bacterium]
MHRLVAMVCFAAVALYGQTNRGSITGTVTDSTGAIVPGATIRITNLGTNEVRTVTSAQNGTYAASNLEPVTYRVEAEANGFNRVSVDNVKVDTASNATVNIKLELGSVSTKVDVQAETVMVNTESGTLSSTISERQIRDVPLVNRSVLDLALTLPNVGGSAGSENPGLTAGTPCPGCNLSIGGGRPLSSLILADGTNNTGVALARSIVSFTPETVQEFTVQTSAFSAEYGTTGGGIINATTKSGTNELHGTVLWYNRNPDFAAAPFTLATTNRPSPTLKYNQFSLTAGGPVYIPKLYHGKNRTFWFFAYEPDYRRDRLDQYGLLPTDAMRGGDFSGLVNTASGWLPQSVVDQFQSIAPKAVALVGDNNIYNQFTLVGNQLQQITLASGASYAPFPNNVIPKNLLDSAAQKALAYVAEPGPYFLDSNGNISNILAPRLLQQDEKRYTVRIDHVITDSNRIYGRFTTTPIVKIQGTPVSPTNNGAIYSWGRQAMIADTHTFSPTLLNDLRINYTRGRFSQTVDPQWDPSTGANLNTAFGLPSITNGGLPTFNTLFPGKSFGNGGSTATGFGGAASTNLDDREERYAITDIVYKTHGAFNLRFGVDLSHALQNVIPLYGAFGGVFNFSNYPTNSNDTSSGTGGNAFASFLLGVPQGTTGVPAATLRSVEVPYYYRWNNAAAFIQNDWHVKPNLTLNFGLRYSLQMPRTEKYNHQGVFRPDLAQTVPLPAPLTLADGRVVTSTLEVPFAFSGVGGNSRYLTPPQYRDFEPRFGFAWSPHFLDVHHVTLRGGWGMSHAPISGFAELPSPDFGATANFNSTAPSTTANPDYVMRLGENPPQLTPATVQTQVYGPGGPPANGISYTNGLYYQQTLGGFAISPNYHTPYVNNWNFTVSWQAARSTIVELAYSGSMGIHLFMGQEDINPKDSNLISAQLAQNVNTTATVNDPLGRVNPITGKILTVQNGALGSPYLGLSSLYLYYDSSGNSIRHAGYINVVHRSSHGLLFNANYTYAKSIDDASSAGGDKNILTAVNGQVGGQVAFGGTRADDRSVSTYDQRHVIHGSAVYDLPFGRGRQFLANAWKPLDFLVGGWTTTALVSLNSGFPYAVYLSDANQLGDLTHSIRPNVTPGVPLLNPNYSTTCPIGGTCEPYLNPAAFQRTPLGELGNAPRTFDGVRGPWQNFLDLSVQKNFSIGEKRRLQFRVDALNALNHPVFAVYPDNAGGSDFMGAPSTATLSTSAYNTWAAANGQPAYNSTAGTPGNVLYNQIVNMVNAQKNASGALPANFFSIPLPQNFWAKAANSYDITTLQGYKLYQLRNAYAAAGAASNFGTLYSLGQPRYFQFGVKFIW